MERSLHNNIVYSIDEHHINSPAFYDCVVHLICIEGNAFIIYNDQPFEIAKGDIAVLSELNVTSKYLSDTIKRVTGHSISSHINSAATSIILEYLKDNRLSITQIADEMQFTSVSYFSRYCTKHIGMSPAQYRLAGAKS